MVTLLRALRNPFSAAAAGGGTGAPGTRGPGLGDAEPGAGRRRRRRAGAGRGPGGGALPRPRRPPPARMRAGDRNPAPRSARVHLRSWGARPRVPRAPSPSPRLPAERSRPWKRTRCPLKRALTRGEAAPGAGRARTSAREGAAALRCAAPAPAPAERPAPPPRLRLPLPRARPRRSAALPARRPRPDPPLPAQGCGPRRREQRICGPSSPLPGRERWGGGGGERRRKRLSTWTCLWSVAKESSQITAPGEKNLQKNKTKQNKIPATVFVDA